MSLRPTIAVRSRSRPGLPRRRRGVLHAKQAPPVFPSAYAVARARPERDEMRSPLYA
jgi:hypothetical protein